MYKNGSVALEDEAPGETRFRRTQQVLSPTGRPRRGPGMPVEMPDEEEDDLPRPRRRFKTARKWWKPESKVGRVFVGIGALALIAGCAYLWLTAKKYLEHDNRFRIAGVSSIQTVGLSQVSRADILPVFGADIGKNIFFINLAERRKDLEQIAWIKQATVMRLLPDQLRVSVVERTPIAFARHGQQIGLVDADGVLLAMSPVMMTQHHYSFPVVTGIDAGDPLSSRQARMAVYQKLMRDLDANGQHLSDQISEVDLTDPEDARVLMPEQGGDILAHFGEDHFLERYQRYKAHIAEWRQEYPHLSAVDLRYDRQVVLEMAPGTTSAANSQATVSSTTGKPDDTANAAAPMVVAKTAQARPIAHHDRKHKEEKRAHHAHAVTKPIHHATSHATTSHTTGAWDQ
jgi:cell division protein FtsQ